MSYPPHGALNCDQQRRNPQRPNTNVDDRMLSSHCSLELLTQQDSNRLTCYVNHLAVASQHYWTPCSKNRHTCLSKHCWFPSPAVSSRQDWSNHLSLPLCPYFAPCLCLHRRAWSATALSVRRHLIGPFQQFILQPLAKQLFFPWAETNCR